MGGSGVVGVEEVYKHCAKKVARALHYKQGRKGWVWEEVRGVMGVRVLSREGGEFFFFSFSSSLPLSLGRKGVRMR